MSLENRKRSEDLKSLQSVADVVRHGRLRWFRNLEGEIIGCYGGGEVKCRGKEDLGRMFEE